MGGKGVGRARIDPRQVALKLQSKSITAHNTYYVKWIILCYQGLSFFTTAPIVFLLRFGAFPSFFCTGTVNQASPRG